jgi:hypothetical protein
MTTLTQKCFEAQFRVHPTRAHPNFETINFGILIIWLFDQDMAAAATRAKAIAIELPYRISDGKVFSVNDDERILTYQVDGISKAALVGFHTELRWYGPEVNEQETLKDWPLLLPPLED